MPRCLRGALDGLAMLVDGRVYGLTEHGVSSAGPRRVGRKASRWMLDVRRVRVWVERFGAVASRACGDNSAGTAGPVMQERGYKTCRR